MENTVAPATRDLKWWMDRIAASNGGSVLLPEELQAIIKEVQEVDKEVQAMLNVIAEKQIKNEQKMQGVWLTFRDQLAKNGRPDIWMKEVGLDENALADGFFVANVWDKKNR